MAFKVRARLVIIWMCLTTCLHLFAQLGEIAQPDQRISKAYSMLDGLPTEGITDVMQDKMGFIWLATYSGLCKFDGNKFTTFANNPLSSNSLRNNFLWNVFEDRKGRLWIGHVEGFDVFDPRTEKFILHWPDRGNVIAVQRFREAKNGNIWICTSGGVFLSDIETLLPTKIPEIPTTFIWDIAETKDGSLWVAANGDGFFYLDKESDKLVQYVNNPEDHDSPGKFGWTVMVDATDRVWLGTRAGLDLFNPTNKTFKHYLSITSALDLEENSDGKLLVGSNSGLHLFDPESRIGLVLASEGAKVLKDNQGTIWAASLNGLRRIDPIQNKFRYQEHSSGNSVGSIVEDRFGNIWVQYQQHSVQQGAFGSFFLDRDKNVWRSSIGRLEKLSRTNQVQQTISIPTDMNPITCFMDSQGSVWIGAFGAVGKYDLQTDTFESVEPPSYQFGTVYCFLEDSLKNLWIGSTGGLSRYNLKTGKLEIFQSDSHDSLSLSNNVVYTLTQTQDGTIWVGTAGGLNKIISNAGSDIPKFIHWRTNSSGLPNNDVYCIVDGGDGTLWMTCGNKISHFNPQQNVFRNYDESDGLSGKNFRGSYYLSGKGLRASDGKIYFGGTSLVVFHPDSLKDNSFVPPVVFTGFSIRNQTVPVDGTDADTLKWKSPLESAISYAEKIQLTYDQNDFTIEFSALNYVNPERNQYKYKLEPYQNEWISTTADSRSAHYTNLDPGRYTFRVIGSNNDGVWNQEGATLGIVIFPPWWQTWWAYSLYGLTLAAMFLYWRRFDIKRVRLKHRAEHLSELDNLKTRFFTNISHEFRTPITLIQGPLKEMYAKATGEEERSGIGIMLQNAKRLSRLINQLLDLSKLEAGKMKLHACQVELVQFLREIAASYESIADDKKIKYFFYPEVTELSPYIDVEKLEKVVHNLLSNAFKFTKEGGEIILNLREDGKHCNIIVKDTGIGIPADHLDKIFDRFYQVDSSQTREHEGTGLGMTLAKELVELHHGTISVASLEGKGATFTVRLPLGKEHLHKDEINDPDDFKKSEIAYEDLMVENSGESKTEKSSIPADDHQPVLLIVEDNADMRHYIGKIFSNHYKVIEAVNGSEGITKAEEFIPELIISDVMMPQMDGYKFCERIKTKELTSHIPVILLTAKADRESKLTGLETGADDYLSKPFDADELKLIVRNRIEQRKKIRERFSREITLEPKQIAITSFDEKFLNKVMTIIEDHIGDESFSIDELSREVGYSNMHFYRKLKALAGETPSQFLRTIRLKRAAELLRKKSDNVTQIAYSVGFNSLSYFNKCFKEQFGVTPGQFADESLKSKV